jgi:RNA polymerase sigma factor (sigma-70 family)
MSINGLMDILFRRYSKELLFFASQRASHAAEDLVQEAYLRLMQHPNLESIGNHRAFLYRTTSNLTVDFHRRQVLEARYQQEPTPDLEIDAQIVKAQTPSPELHLSQQQELDMLRDMLQELPEITRNAFLLNRIEGLSHAEVAKRLGISVRNSERYLAAALRHLLKHRSFDE